MATAMVGWFLQLLQVGLLFLQVSLTVLQVLKFNIEVLYPKGFSKHCLNAFSFFYNYMVSQKNLPYRFWGTLLLL